MDDAPVADGSRMATHGLEGVEVWDARGNRVLFAETVRLSGFETRTTLSPDGRRVAWTAGAKAYMRDLESAEEKTFSLDGKPIQIRFSPDSSRLAIATTERLALGREERPGALDGVSSNNRRFERRGELDLGQAVPPGSISRAWNGAVRHGDRKPTGPLPDARVGVAGVDGGEPRFPRAAEDQRNRLGTSTVASAGR